MSLQFDGLVMCLYCGVLVSIELAAEQKHLCHPAGVLGPYLPPTYRPAILRSERADEP